MEPDGVVRFGVFEADLDAGELRRRGHRVALQRLPLRLLALLVQRPGEVVTVEQIRRLWPPDLHVGFDHCISAALHKLRTALGDSGQNPRFVETVPGRGYRFVAPVSVANAPLTAQRRVAVRPFETFGSSPKGVEALAEGLTEALLTELARRSPRRLGVMKCGDRSHEASRDPLALGRELGVDALVEGSVRSEGSRVRVHVRLVSTRDGTQRWAQRLDGELGDALELELTLASRLTEALVRELLERPRQRAARVTSPEARDALLRARHHLERRTPAALAKGLACVERAVALDPESAGARATLGVALGMAVEYGLAPAVQIVPRLCATAGTALELDPELPDAHAVRGLARHRFGWRWREAERDYRNALAIDPSCVTALQWYAELLSQTGRHSEALGRIEQARALDPLSPIVGSVHAWIAFHAGDYPLSVATSRDVLDLDEHFGVARFVLGRSLLQKGELDEARGELEQVVETSDASPFALASLGFACAADARTDAARSCLARLRTRQGADVGYFEAKLLSALGDIDAALTRLEQAWADGTGWVADLGVDPEWEPLRSFARFDALVSRLGLPRGWGRPA